MGLAAGVLWLLTPTAQAQCQLELVGPKLVEFESCMGAVGAPPEDPAEAEAWAQPAVDRILAIYEEEGYLAARAWTRVRGGSITIEVDEGEIHRVRILGIGGLNRLTLADNLALVDGGVLHAATLQASLDQMASLEPVRSVTWSLSDGDDFLQNAMGVLVPERVLNVHIVTDEDLGLGVDIDIMPLWGLVSGLRWDGRSERRGDRLSMGVQLATPYQQWVFEQEPQLRWVFGAANVEYRGPDLGRSIAPLVGLQSSLAQYNRLDIGVLSALVLQNRADLGLAFAVDRPLRGRIGAAVEHASVPEFERDPATPNVRHDPLVRVLGTAQVEVSPDDGTLRTDLRDRLALTGEGGWVTDEAVFLRLRLQGQACLGIRRHDLLLRVNGVLLEGGQRFFDQLRLAGKYQRVFFADRYWASRAVQSDTAFRLWLHRNVKLGVYHDITLFETPDGRPDWVDAVGPGLHLLLLDKYAFDTYYGFGWSPDGFGHNLSLSLKSVY